MLQPGKPLPLNSGLNGICKKLLTNRKNIKYNKLEKIKNIYVRNINGHIWLFTTKF